MRIVPVVLAVLIATLPAGAGATASSSFGDWTATFSGTFDYQWSEPNHKPCDPNGGGSVGASFSGQLGDFGTSYVNAGPFEAFGLIVNTTNINGYARVADDRRINPPPPGQSTCIPATIDKSGCGQRGFNFARFSLDSTNSQDRPALHLTVNLGGMLNAFARAGECYNGGFEDFSYFPGNSPRDSDTGNWGGTYGALVGPRLTMAMFAGRQAFTVTAQDTHRSRNGPSSYTGRRLVKVTFTPAGCGGSSPQAVGAARSIRAAASATCGLDITSPPDNSTISMTDADFFYPTAGDNQRQPKQRFLIVEGTGASTATRTTR